MNSLIHHVVYDEKQMRVDMYLKSMQRQTVSIPKSGIRTVFEKDEMIHTENSFKYTPDSIKLMLSQAGLKIENMWCDMFSLTLHQTSCAHLFLIVHYMMFKLFKIKVSSKLRIYSVQYVFVEFCCNSASIIVCCMQDICTLV